MTDVLNRVARNRMSAGSALAAERNTVKNRASLELSYKVLYSRSSRVFKCDRKVILQIVRCETVRKIFSAKSIRILFGVGAKFNKS